MGGEGGEGVSLWLYVRWSYGGELRVGGKGGSTGSVE